STVERVENVRHVSTSYESDNNRSRLFADVPTFDRTNETKAALSYNRIRSDVYEETPVKTGARRSSRNQYPRPWPRRRVSGQTGLSVAFVRLLPEGPVH